MRYTSHSFRAQDNVLFSSIMPSSSPNPMFDHMLESSLRDDSNKWATIGLSKEIVVLIEVILSSDFSSFPRRFG